MKEDKLPYEELENSGSDDYYKFLFENSLDAIAYNQVIYKNNVPVDFIFLEVNRAFEEATRVKNLQGKKLTEVFPKTDETSSRLIEICAAVAKTRKPKRFDIYLSPLKARFSVSAISPKKGFFITIFHNITEHKPTEQALVESESNLNSLINNRNESIWSIDSDYRLVTFNNFFKKSLFTKYKLDAHKGMNSLNLLPSALQKKFKHKYDEALLGKKVDFKISDTFNSKDNYYEIFLNPIVVNGKVTGVSGLSLDITEQTLAGRSLLQSRANMLAIIENTQESIWAINTSYEILYANKNFVSAFQQNFSIYLEPGVNLLLSLPKPLQEVWKKHYDRALNNEIFSIVEEVDVGEIILYIEVNMYPIVANGEVIGASFFGKDITERKKEEQTLIESEKRYKSLFHENKSIMLLIDPKEGLIIDANVSALNYYGYSKKKLLTLTVSDLNVLPKARVEKEMRKAVAGKKNYFEFKHKLANGSIRDVHVYSGKVQIENKDLLYSIVHDVTPQRIAEKALKKSENQLRELNVTKDKLFSIIAHDLRSPVSSIIGLSDLLIRDRDAFEANESENYLGVINSSAKNTLTLLDNLLNWAELQTGRIRFNPKKLVLSSFINEVIGTLYFTAKLKNISINLILAEKIEIYTDEDMVNTVLRNLISNSIKFTKSGGNIDVKVIAEAKQVVISVTDNGVGMKKEMLKRLFDISGTVTKPGTSNEKGSGLGLVLCKEFVEKLGGQIWAESQEGKGSKFKFTLPLD